MPVLVVAGDVDRTGLPPLPDDVELVSLVERFGVDAAYGATVDCVAAVVAERLAR